MLHGELSLNGAVRPVAGALAAAEVASRRGLRSFLCAKEVAREAGGRMAFLRAAGGAKHHKELLAPFGLDASDPAFWDKGLSLIEGFIDELEAMG